MKVVPLFSLLFFLFVCFSDGEELLLENKTETSPPLVIYGQTWKGRLLREGLWLSVAFCAAIVINYYCQNYIHLIVGTITGEEESGNGGGKKEIQQGKDESIVEMEEEKEEEIEEKGQGKADKEKEKEKEKNHPLLSPEVVNACKCWVIVGVILLCCFVLDYDHTFPPMNKTFNLDYFLFVSVIFAVFASMWIEEAKIPQGRCGMLNRDQTEEWRGWMQISFLMYHYFAAAPAYNLIRIFVACYVWMTGFGHFSYFWVRKDWSLIRFVKSLFRMNFLVIGIMLVMETEYVHYYICPMHTVFFFLVWGLTYPFREYHHTHNWVVWAKLFVGLLFCATFWLNDFVFAAVFRWFPFLYYEGSLHEWQFRSGLDRFATLFGMVFAFVYPDLEKILFRLDEMGFQGTIIKSTITAFFSFVLYVWWITLGTMEKFAYNAWHPYTSIIPIVSIIFVRNMFPRLRKYYLWGFSWIGKITLETYLLQFHLMLNNNNKQIVNFFDDYPNLNFLFTWLLLLGMAYQAFKCTVVLSEFIYPYSLTSRQVIIRSSLLCVSSLFFVFLALLSCSLSISTDVLWFFWLLIFIGLVNYFSMKIQFKGPEDLFVGEK